MDRRRHNFGKLFFIGRPYINQKYVFIISLLSYYIVYYDIEKKRLTLRKYGLIGVRHKVILLLSFSLGVRNASSVPYLGVQRAYNIPTCFRFMFKEMKFLFVVIILCVRRDRYLRVFFFSAITTSMLPHITT